jgi:excisionase family DNA binding protein
MPDQSRIRATERRLSNHHVRHIRIALRICARRRTMKTWLTVAEGAEYAGISRDTVYTACERGELRHARIGGRRAIRLKPEWIDAWLERYAQGVQEPRTGRHGQAQSGAM